MAAVGERSSDRPSNTPDIRLHVHLSVTDPSG
jgi:hypothetical protein